MVNDKELIANLEAAVKTLREQRKDLDKGYNASVQGLTKREGLLQQTLEGLRSMNGNSPSSTKPLSISDERYETVLGFFSKHPRVKQTDLVKKLKLNSGTVSVALRIAEEKGLVQRTEEKDEGSQVWITTTENQSDRETVVTPGKGVRQGRKKVAA